MGRLLFTMGGIALLGLLASACGAPQSSLRPAPGPDESLYRDRCGRCHDAFPRHAYSPTEWPAVVQRMRHEARLTDPEVARLVGWLTKGHE